MLTLLLACSVLLLSPVLCTAQNAAAHSAKSNTPPRDEIWYRAVNQESEGNLKHLKGDASVVTSEMKISADTMDFDTDTDWVYAHGHVHMDHFATGDKINADHGEYNIRTDEGKFYVVNGTAPAKILTNPAVLTTTNPFYFQALSADRFKDRYVLHKGFITDCKIPKPWWIMQSPLFDVIPGNRAIARNAVLRVRHLPIFYLPFFYRPLGRNPRQSGFLTPTFGHSSFYGWLYGGGYYWAMNRSYDMTGVIEEFSQRGPAFNYQFRGRPNETTDFNFLLYDVDDQGVPGSSPRVKEGGLEFELTGNTQIFGFTGRADYHYLSTFLFRQAFSYSFATLISNEVNSVGWLQRRYDGGNYTLNFVMQRNQDYVAPTLLNQPQDEVVIQKLPSIEASGRDQEILGGPLPVWFTFGASAGALSRDEPTGTQVSTFVPPAAVSNSGAVGRLDAEPHVYTAFQYKGFSIEPGITFGATDYTNSYGTNTTAYAPIESCLGYAECPPTPTTTVSLADTNLFRHYADFTLDFRLPTLERIFTPPKYLHLGAKLKHVVEAEAQYEYVTGVNQFQRIIHFDETDIISNTNQLNLSLTNRLYKKDKAGAVSELLTWRLTQQRYFDPTFGGVAVNGQRIVTSETEDLTPYPFLDGPRNTSPVVSSLTVNPYSFFSVGWRAEYDTQRQNLRVSTYTGIFRYSKLFAQLGENLVRTDPLLFPQSNQLTFGGGYGSYNRKGWNFGGTELYDLLLHRTVFQFVQGTYNTDCCGFGIQYRRINFGIRDENQYLFSFSLANLGTFGSIQRQERLF